MTYTHYDYLDLAPGASPARIEAAYAAVLERFQYGATDAGQDLSGLVRMIHAAYEVLSRPDSRSSYDAQLAREAAEADAELKRRSMRIPPKARGLVQDVPAAAAHRRSRRSRHDASARSKFTAAGKVFFPDCKQRCGRRPYSPPGTECPRA